MSLLANIVLFWTPFTFIMWMKTVFKFCGLVTLSIGVILVVTIFLLNKLMAK